MTENEKKRAEGAISENSNIHDINRERLKRNDQRGELEELTANISMEKMWFLLLRHSQYTSLKSRSLMKRKENKRVKGRGKLILFDFTHFSFYFL